MDIKLENKAAQMFAVVPKATVLFLTSDGQGFTDKEKAMDHSRYLKDKAIQKFERNSSTTEVVTDATSNDDEEAKDRVQLLEQYEELFGKPAAHNIGTDTLRERIASKVEGLAKEKAVDTTAKES